MVGGRALESPQRNRSLACCCNKALSYPAMSMFQTMRDRVAPVTTNLRPQYCYPVVATESSRFHPEPDDEGKVVAIHKTHIEHVFYSQDLANTLAKHYFIRQHSESETDANEDKFGRPTPRACKGGIWVPKNTTKCSMSEVQKRRRIEVVLGSGPERLEILVEVLREKFLDANGPWRETM